MESLLPWVCIFLNICCFTPCVDLIWFIKWGTVQNSVGCAVVCFLQCHYFFFCFLQWFVGVCVTFSAVAVEHSQHSVEVFLCLIYSWGFGYAWFIAQVTSRIFICLCLRVTKIQKNNATLCIMMLVINKASRLWLGADCPRSLKFCRRLQNISLYSFTTPAYSSVVREECLKHFTHQFLTCLDCVLACFVSLWSSLSWACGIWNFIKRWIYSSLLLGCWSHGSPGEL